MNKVESKVLELLEKDCRMSQEGMASLLGISLEEVAASVKSLEDEGIICGYKAIVNADAEGKETVTALIEVKVTPQRGLGFDRIAERIYHFPEVDSIYLMSGDYDFCVFIEGKSMKEISRFVFEKLATLPFIQSTSTHFVLKKYKDHGFTLGKKVIDKRLKVSA